jgi:hypothetical protein
VHRRRHGRLEQLRRRLLVVTRQVRQQQRGQRVDKVVRSVLENRDLGQIRLITFRFNLRTKLCKAHLYISKWGGYL